MTQGARVKSVHKAIGSPKDHVSYCSIPVAIDQLTTHHDTSDFSKTATKHRTICSEIKKIQTISKKVAMSRTLIEPLSDFEPYFSS